MNVPPDLFGAAGVAGLSLRDDFLSAAQEAALIGAINATDLRPFRFQRWIGKRLTCSYGWSYDFETGAFSPAEPMPDWLTSIQARAAIFAGLAPDDLVQALLIRYDPGAGIGWHKDRPVFEHVVGISLGHPTPLRLRKRTDTGFARAKVQLAPRSIYHLFGEARHHWEHSIVPMELPRWSITFRSLSAKVRSN